MTKKDSFKSPEQSRVEWLGQENEWCNLQPWRPLNAHVEAVAAIISGRAVETDCLQVLKLVSASGSGVSEMASTWNLLIEKKDGLELLTSLCRTTLSDLIADGFDKDSARDTTWASECPEGITAANIR